MIKSTFLFLPKIKSTKEIFIWKQGILNWDDFLNKDKIKGISPRLKKEYDKIIFDAKKALHENNSNFFIGRLPSNDTWRLYDYFKEEAIFLDIETSSATSKNSFLTAIGMFDGIDTKTMVRDVNLDIKKLADVLKNYRLIITFNGSSFDIPFLKKKHPGLIPEVPHIDLRHVCKKAGFIGGLKEIEKHLGIKREKTIVERMYGGDPIKLWRMYKGSGDRHYLELLVNYNEEDIINLKKIAEHCIKILKEKIKRFTSPQGHSQGR